MVVVTRCLRCYSIKISRRFSSIAVSNTFLQDTQDPVQSVLTKLVNVKNLDEIEHNEWKSVLQHMTNLKIQKEYSKVLSIGQCIFAKKTGVIKRGVYDTLFSTLAECHQTTKQHSELAMLLMEKYIEHGYTSGRSQNPIKVLDQLCKVLVNASDPLLKYRYFQLTQTLTSLPKSKNTVARLYENQLKLCISSGEFEQAILIIKEAALNGFSLFYHLNEIVFLTLLENGDIDYAWEMLNRMDKMDAIYARTWGLFITHAADQYHYEALKWAYKTAAIPGSVVLSDWCYQRMTDVGVRNGDYEMVRWCNIRMKRRKDVFYQSLDEKDSFYYIPVIEAHAASGEIEPAFEILERMRESAEQVQVRHFPQLIDSLLNQQALTTATNMFITIVDKGTCTESVKTLLMNILVKSTLLLNPSVGLEFYQECIKGLDIAPNEETYMILLRTIKPTDPLFVEQIHSECGGWGIEISREMYITTILALYDSGYKKSVLKYIEDMNKLYQLDDRVIEISNELDI